MAAVAYAFNKVLGMSGASPQIEVTYLIADPAQQGDGSGHDAFFTGVIVTLDPLEPFGWDLAIEDAIIAHAASLPNPFTVTSARCLTPVYSDALLKESHLFQAPATGFSTTIPNSVRTLLLNPAGTLATGTITMPGNPQNGRSVKIASSQTITLLTLSPNAGQSFAAGAAIVTLLANGFAEYTYRFSNTTWYRVG